jgi:hypothetical protein
MLLIALSCCSSSKYSKPVSLYSSSSPHLVISEKSSGEQTYSEIKSLNPSSNLVGYATAIRSCGYPEKSSLRGTTRQIFVGLEKLRIIKQEPIEIAPHRLWAVEAEALSEGFPISVASYTLKQDKCFIDFILWVPNHSVSNSSSASIEQEQQHEEFEQLRASFQSLVADTLPELTKQSS